MRKESILQKGLIGKVLFILVFLTASACLSAQDGNKGISVKGRITDSDGSPIEIAFVVLNNSISVLTDQDGRFVFNNLKPGTYDYNISCLGYETQKGQIHIRTGKEELNIRMKESALALQEVTVTAEQSSMGSKSRIGQDAIRHIQPKSVADMLQLLPGNLTVNPTLNTVAQANIREIDGNRNNALGTAVILDGVPLSNDGNLQAFSPTKNGARSNPNENGMNNQTTAGRGIDLRTVAADNIESIEVIRGIPSVEYGNLTSGVVIVKTKSGRTPLEVKMKADPFSKLVYAGKGFNLKQGGAINLGLDWSQSYGDIRRHYLGYNRITASFGYSNIFNVKGHCPISFNLRGSFYSNIYNRKKDTQMKELELNYKNENIGGRLSVNGDIRINNRWITAVNYDLSAEVARLLDTNHNWVSNPDGVITNSRVDGTAPAQFMTKAYFSDYRLEGIPISIYAQIKANKYIQLSENSYTNFKIGTDYRLDCNRGNGLSYDIKNPPQAFGAQTLRPRSFKDIPALHNLSAFVENTTKIEWESTSLQTVAGVRFSSLLLDEEKSRHHSITVVEPRINISYTILSKNNNPVFDNLSICGGFGISNKMPTLLYLYPDKAYFDNISLSQIGSGHQSSMALMTTRVVSDTQNPRLKPATGTKWEMGIDFRIGKVKGFITYFREHHRNEFGFNSQLIWLRYNRYNVPVGATDLTFENNQVHYTHEDKRQVATITQRTEMNTWGMPDNVSRSDKQGIEYTLDLGTIKALHTSVNIDGAWFHIRRTSSIEQLNYIDKNYDYVPVKPAGEGTIRQRFNTQFRFITHIPKVRMIFTTSAQVVWHESERIIYRTDNGKERYHLSTNGERLIVSPVGFYDREGNYTKWKNEFEDNPEYSLMNGNYLLYAFRADNISPWVLLNFRLTKELGRIAELSFMANNFLNLSKWHINKHSLSKSQLYPDLYFGAELKLKF